MSPINKHIIFDLDGTLIDSSSGVLFAYEQTFKQCGIKPKVELQKEIIGPPLLETLSLLSGAEDHDELVLLKEVFKKYYDVEGILLTNVFPGVNEMLEELFKEGFNMYIATNKRIVPTEKIINNLNWDKYFIEVCSLDSFKSPLSSKDKILKQLIKNHEIKNKAYYVGDTREDLEASEQCDLSFILAKWGYGEIFLSNNLEISSPKDLIRHLIK